MYTDLFKNISLFLGVFFLFETIALLLFRLIRKKFHPAERHAGQSVLKGMLERMLLYYGLVNNIASVLIFFGAIKLGTRIKPDDPESSEKIRNDYFLIGNFASVLLALLAYSLFNWLHDNF